MTAPKPPFRVADMAEKGKRQRSDAAPNPAVGADKAPPGLYLVATPIGHLGDVTLRALETLAGCDVIACEDTRVTRKLADRYGIATPLTPYHEHNAAEARPQLLARLAGGEAVALVSDAGTPLISDPGYKLVRAAQDAGHAVTAIPGASSVLTALSVAGLPTDRFFFEGFLPAKQAARQKRIAALASIPATLVLFESGPRLAAALADLPRAHQAARGGPPRRSCNAGARLCRRRRDARRDRHCGGAAGRSRDGKRRRRRHAAAGADAGVAQGRGRRSRARQRKAAPRGLSARARARQGR